MNKPGLPTFANVCTLPFKTIFICDLLVLTRCIPSDEPIDLLNVAFEQHRHQPSKTQSKHRQRNTEIGPKKDPYEVPDRISGQSGVLELNPKRKWNFIEVVARTFQSALFFIFLNSVYRMLRVASLLCKGLEMITARNEYKALASRAEYYYIKPVSP